jgi:formylglycine-generating enzyme required for sulfatase activity
LIAFAAQPGAVALDDGRDGHSPYTWALLKHIATPNLDIRIALGRVRDDVLSVTNNAQKPSNFDSLGGNQMPIVTAPVDSQTSAMQQNAIDSAAQDWAKIEGTKNVKLLDEFVQHFPTTFYAALARNRIEQLGKPSASSTPCGERGLKALDEGPSSPCPQADQAVAPLTGAQERTLQVKDTFRECEGCPEMVVVPSGSFWMGAPDSPGDFEEHPQHDVTFWHPFAVGKFHVTVDQFATFVEEAKYDASYTPCATFNATREGAPMGPNPGFAQEGLHPVVCLRWYDAKAYVDWLAQKTGKPYRLLSEAEFEYAARAETEREVAFAGWYDAYWFGRSSRDSADDLCRYANGADQTAREMAELDPVASCRDGYPYTSPVGAFLPNAFGLYDMAGNASQWVADCWHDSYQGAPRNGSVWTSASDCLTHVVRGGSWHDPPVRLTATGRRKGTAGLRASDIGFRVARTLVAPTLPPDPCSGPGTVSFPSRCTPLTPSQEREIQPKATFKECEMCPEMVVVPSGSFTMGSPEGGASEEPQHLVKFEGAFAVGKYAVTFAEWGACIEAGGCNGYRPHDRGWGRGDRPVIEVSWEDAQAYVKWLSGRTGKTYRLLSEAEREYVARAGTKTRFWWGPSISTQQANYDGNSTTYGGPKGVYRGRTMPVYAFEPNPWGLFQVHGNVLEWTADCWHGGYSGAPGDGSPWTVDQRSGRCDNRVLRGGSWFHGPGYLRAAARFEAAFNDRERPYSFRVARTTDAAPSARSDHAGDR